MSEGTGVFIRHFNSPPAEVEAETQAVAEVLRNCASLLESRGKTYNAGGVRIRDYFPRGLFDIFYEVHKDLVRAEAASISTATMDVVEDKLLDAINYLAMGVALFVRPSMQADAPEYREGRGKR